MWPVIDWLHYFQKNQLISRLKEIIDNSKFHLSNVRNYSFVKFCD